MGKVNFDDYAENYDKILANQLKFFDRNERYFAEYKIKILKNYLAASPGKILEYGCGVGRNLPPLLENFPDSEIHACDISEKSLAIAQKHHPQVQYFLSGGSSRKKEYDLIFVALVFHHIDPTLRVNALKEIHDFLTPHGNVFIFEHNPYNPVTRHLVNTCPFDADAVLLKRKELESLLRQCGFKVKLGRYTLYFPSFLKRLRFLESILGFVPLGGQYFIKAGKR